MWYKDDPARVDPPEEFYDADCYDEELEDSYQYPAYSEEEMCNIRFDVESRSAAWEKARAVRKFTKKEEQERFVESEVLRGKTDFICGFPVDIDAGLAYWHGYYTAKIRQKLVFDKWVEGIT
jgi:hypothetical protein